MQNIYPAVQSATTRLENELAELLSFADELYPRQIINQSLNTYICSRLDRYEAATGKKIASVTVKICLHKSVMDDGLIASFFEVISTRINHVQN